MKKTSVGLLALTLFGLIVSAGLVSAFGARFVGEEHGLAIKQAIEENDFEAWKAAMMETLTQENFDKLAERHAAMFEKREQLSAVKQAIEDGNYEAYKEAVENLMNSHEPMSEEDFNSMIERYNAKQSGEGFGPLGRFGLHKKGFGRHHMPW